MGTASCSEAHGDGLEGGTKPKPANSVWLDLLQFRTISLQVNSVQFWQSQVKLKLLIRTISPESRIPRKVASTEGSLHVLWHCGRDPGLSPAPAVLWLRWTHVTRLHISHCPLCICSGSCSADVVLVSSQPSALHPAPRPDPFPSAFPNFWASALASIRPVARSSPLQPL